MTIILKDLRAVLDKTIAVHIDARPDYDEAYADEAIKLRATLVDSVLGALRGWEDTFRQRVAELEAEAKRLKDAGHKLAHEVEQTAGVALGYPRYCDDQELFPGATDADGVCVGEHVAQTVVSELARKYGEAQAEAKRLRDIPENTAVVDAAFEAWLTEMGLHDGPDRFRTGVVWMRRARDHVQAALRGAIAALAEPRKETVQHRDSPPTGYEKYGD